MKNANSVNATTLRALVHDAGIHEDLSDLNALLAANGAETLGEDLLTPTAAKDEVIFAAAVESLEDAGVTVYNQ